MSIISIIIIYIDQLYVKVNMLICSLIACFKARSPEDHLPLDMTHTHVSITSACDEWHDRWLQILYDCSAD